MMHWLDRIPHFWKVTGVYLCIMGVFIITGFFMAHHVAVVFSQQFHQPMSLLNFVTRDVFRYLFFGSLIGYLIILVYYWDYQRFFSKLNVVFKHALSERRLDHSLTEFYSGKTPEDVLRLTTDLFSLIRSLEQMKSSRIQLESETISTLMNNVMEGILFVNDEKCVTHINHECEQMLKLIPGEILGQSIYRKIVNTLLLESLEYALASNHKITNKPIMFRDAETFYLNIFPLKNKTGEIPRAIIILSRAEHSDLNSEPR